MWALRGVSSAGLERLPVTQKVEGSSPLHPATFILRLVAVFLLHKSLTIWFSHIKSQMLIKKV